ncbi:MAG: exo-alpha-sialidase, partial [Lentisphaerae bacterium]
MRHPIFSIAKHPTMYLAFPDLTMTHTGRLWCCYNRCKHHHDRSVTQIFLQYSDDWGTTWSEPQPLMECLDHDPEERFWNCPRLSTLSDGRIVAVVDQIKGLKCRHSQAREQINRLWFSDDNGHHWQGPLPTPVKGIVPDQLIELRHGPF